MQETHETASPSVMGMWMCGGARPRWPPGRVEAAGADALQSPSTRAMTRSACSAARSLMEASASGSVRDW